MAAVIPKVPTPVKGDWSSVILGGRQFTTTSEYHAGRSGGRWHTGVDFATPTGTNVNIPLSGTVVEAGWGAGGGSAFGNAVLVRLTNGDYVYFAHLSKIGVRKGDELKAGAYIGKSGATGNATGPHLHVEVRRAATHGRWSRNDSYFYDPVWYFNQMARTGGVTPAGPPPTPNVVSGGSTVTGGSGGGGGGGVGKVAFSRKDFYAMVEAQFGDLNALLTMDDALVKENGGKSLRWALDEAVRQKITDENRFLTLLNQTAWFKKYGRQTTERLAAEKQGLGSFKEGVATAKAEITQVAANYGIKLDDKTLSQLARNSYVYGWSANSAQVLDAVQAGVNAGKGTFTGGTLGDAVEQMETFARDYGVSLSDADLRQFRNDLLDGFGDAKMKDTLQARSAQMYSVFADDISKGVNLRTLISPYLQMAGELLEMSPEQLDMNDPLFTRGRAFQAADPKTGKIVQRPLADFETMIRRDSRWGTTDNARKTASDTVGGILTQMGLL